MNRLSLVASSIFLILTLTACEQDPMDALIQKANDEWVHGRNHSSIELFKSVLERAPNGKQAEEALFRLGEVYHFGQEDDGQAVKYFLETLKLNKESKYALPAQMYIADIVENDLQDYDQAIIENQRLLDDFDLGSRERSKTRFRIAMLYYKKHNLHQAIAELETLVDKYPNSMLAEESSFRIVEILYTLNRCSDAEDLFGSFEKKYPNSSRKNEMEFVRASCLEEKGKSKEALKLFQTLEENYKYPALVKMKIEGLKKRIKKVK